MTSAAGADWLRSAQLPDHQIGFVFSRAVSASYSRNHRGEPQLASISSLWRLGLFRTNLHDRAGPTGPCPARNWEFSLYGKKYDLLFVVKNSTIRAGHDVAQPPSAVSPASPTRNGGPLSYKKTLLAIRMFHTNRTIPKISSRRDHPNPTDTPPEDRRHKTQDRRPTPEAAGRSGSFPHRPPSTGYRPLPCFGIGGACHCESRSRFAADRRKKPVVSRVPCLRLVGMSTQNRRHGTQTASFLRAERDNLTGNGSLTIEDAEDPARPAAATKSSSRAKTPRTPTSGGRRTEDGPSDLLRQEKRKKPKEGGRTVAVARASRGSPTRYSALGTPRPCVSRASCPRSSATKTPFRHRFTRFSY